MAIAKRRAVGWVLLVGAVAGAVAVGASPSPYAIEEPGPVYDTLGSTTVDGKTVPLIQVPEGKGFATSGSLDLLIVSVVGSPQQRVAWSDVITAWFDSSSALVPMDELYPAGTSDADEEQQSAEEMSSSQQSAIAAAERHLGYNVTEVVAVSSVVKGSAAEGVLKAGDELLTVDGATVTNDSLRAAIAAVGTQGSIRLGIRRDGAEQTVSLTPKLQDDGSGTKKPIIGVLLGADYEVPVKVTIHLDDVGGPSAGMMFALGIIDKLTPGQLTGGRRIAGTGTIDADGTVGAIGGIRQKMAGARNAGASWFLAPADNCDEVVGHVPSGLRVVRVSTLDDAVAAVTAIGTGTGAQALPTCSAATSSPTAAPSATPSSGK